MSKLLFLALIGVGFAAPPTPVTPPSSPILFYPRVESSPRFYPFCDLPEIQDLPPKEELPIEEFPAEEEQARETCESQPELPNKRIRTRQQFYGFEDSDDEPSSGQSRYTGDDTETESEESDSMEQDSHQDEEFTEKDMVSTIPGVCLNQNRRWRASGTCAKTGKPTSRSYSISKYGFFKAKHLAEKKRQEMMDCGSIRKRKTKSSAITGVTYTHGVWRATGVMKKTKKHVSKSYSVSQYGDETAKRHAENWRRNMEERGLIETKTHIV